MEKRSSLRLRKTTLVALEPHRSLGPTGLRSRVALDNPLEAMAMVVTVAAAFEVVAAVATVETAVTTTCGSRGIKVIVLFQSS
jgi:hypothetical protein